MKLNLEEFIVTPEELEKYWTRPSGSLPDDIEKIRPEIIKTIVDKYEVIFHNPVIHSMPEHRTGVLAVLLAIELISRMRPKGATS